MSDVLGIDDLLGLHQIADAQIHPDGNTIVYTVASSVVDHTDRRGRSELWLSDDDEPHRITAAETYARSPRWSPDGGLLGYIGRRAGQETEQLCLVRPGWSEARTITTFGNDVQSFRWSPDGTRIAVLVEDPAPADDEERKASGRDQIEYERYHRFSRIWIHDVASGETLCATYADLQVWEFVWSPDGSTLAAIVSDEPYNWSWYRPRIVRIALDSGSVTPLWEPPKTITRPVWSPDGNTIALITCTWSDPGMSGGDVVMLDVASGSVTTVTEGDPRSYTALEWCPAGEELIATAAEDAQAMICRLNRDGQCRLLWKGEAAFTYYDEVVFSLNRACDKIALVRSDCSHPAEVWTVDLDGHEPVTEDAWTCISSANTYVSGKRRHRIETHHWTSFDGTPIHGLVMLPDRADPGVALPLITLIHGGPTGVTGYDFPSHRTMGWAHLLASRGYAVLLPNYRGSMGFGTAFAEANIGDMGGGDLADVLAGIDYCVEAGIADPDRLGVGGWSYGGYLTSWAVTQSARFKAAIAGATITNWTSFHGASTIQSFDDVFYKSDPFNADGIYTFRSPIYSVRTVRTPTLFLHGEQDPICPPGQAHEMWRALKEQGVETNLVIYPREGHGPREREHVRDVLERVLDWFTRFV